MQSKASTIREYLAGLASDQRAVVESIDSAVRSALPEARGSMKYGMPTYEIGDRMFAFNAQKNYFSVYADPEIVKKYKAELKGLDVGKSCIRFRSREKMPVETIRKILNAYGRE
jgi:uncharacterized protein YdhG (YjbR/CyaY superfamily)